jgi:streptogramin lyase
VTGNTVPVPAEPDALIQAGGDIWVASCSGNAVTEINATTKQIVQELNDPSYQFDCPDALAFDGGHIWVANQLGNSITILDASTGSLDRVLTGSQILNPNALAFDGMNIWVSDDSQNGKVGSFISEFSATNFGLIRALTTPRNDQYIFGSPTCFAIAPTGLWVSDLLNIGAIEFSINSGAYIRETRRNFAGADSSACVTYHSGYIWTSSFDTNAIIEYNSTTGIYVRKISNIVNPTQIIFTGSDLFAISESPFDTVREYSSAGVFLKIVARSGKSLGKGIRAILVDGNSLWTANYGSNSVTKYTQYEDKTQNSKPKPRDCCRFS